MLEPGERGRMEAGLAYFGLDGASGDYLLGDTASESVAAQARAETPNSSHLGDLEARLHANGSNLGPVDRVRDLGDLAQTGWGVVFASDIDVQVKVALQPLLELRRSQAGRLYHEYVVQPGESKTGFLRRQGVAAAGSADPEQMPYYLLLVGDPQMISYGFQYQLDVQYAVGRIWFDVCEDYARYARTVVASQSQHWRPRRLTLFGVKNADDAATALSREWLVDGLAKRLPARTELKDDHSAWQIEVTPEQAGVKARLVELLGRGDAPAVLFTASHGMGFPNGHPRQLGDQGGLVCGDWPGPRKWGRREIPTDFYFSADDLADDADVAGLISFHFACYGAGTPRLDDFPSLAPAAPAPLTAIGARLAAPIAPRSFVARLPQHLLAHPRGGALAVIGHIERTLGSSFAWVSDGLQKSNTGAFEDALCRLAQGLPVGAALEVFNQRYAEMASDLQSVLLSAKQTSIDPDAAELARLWQGSVDARGFVVFGDPAVRVPVGPLTDPAPSTVAEARRLTELPPVVEPVDAQPRATAPVRHEVSVQSTNGPYRVRVEVDPSGKIVLQAGDPQAVVAEGEDVAYGLPFVDQAREISVDLARGIKSASEKLVGALATLAADLATLEVVTYVGKDDADLDHVKYDSVNNRFNGSVQCCAVTELRIDGKMAVVVPRLPSGELDEKLWALHIEAVRSAQEQRVELVKAASTAMAGLVSVMRLP